MTDDRKNVKLPFYSTPTTFDDGSGRMQMNPISAVTRNESKQNIRMAMTAATLFAVLAVFLLGRNWTLKEKQNTSVGAMVQVKDAIQGIVMDVNESGNTFTVGLESSTNDQVEASAVRTWTVHLAPGADFNPMKNTYDMCFSVPDVVRSIDSAVKTDCREVVKTGKRVLLQYVTLDIRAGTLIAKTIYGSSQ